jgi:hypothetical protein
MKCIDCKNWRMKGAPLIAYGYGQCQIKSGSNTRAEHSCQQHQAAPAATVSARVKWFAKPAKATRTATEVAE